MSEADQPSHHFLALHRPGSPLLMPNPWDVGSARLQAYAEAGADVLFAPGLRTVEQIRAVVEAVPRPVNVLMLSGCPSVHELAVAGVARVSVGGAFAFAALAAAADAARELREDG